MVLINLHKIRLLMNLRWNIKQLKKQVNIKKYVINYISFRVNIFFKSIIKSITLTAIKFYFLGHFDHEIVSVSVPGRKGTTTLITKDENPRPDTTKETLSKLRPAFIKVNCGSFLGLIFFYSLNTICNVKRIKL